MNIPDAIEPVLGWRSWYCREGAQASSVVHMEHYWPPGVQVAKCLGSTPCPEVPAEDHVCGIYATKTPEQPWDYLYPVYWERWTLMGLIEMWGTTVLGEKGYRSQYARIKSFMLLPPKQEPLLKYEAQIPNTDPQVKATLGCDQISQRYQVPTIIAPVTSEGWLDVDQCNKLFKEARYEKDLRGLMDSLTLEDCGASFDRLGRRRPLV